MQNYKNLPERDKDLQFSIISQSMLYGLGATRIQLDINPVIQLAISDR
jgi:hypothetical protein